MNLLVTIQENLTIILTLTGVVVAIVASFSYWSKEAKKNRKDQDDADSSVRDLLREEIEALNVKIARLTTMSEEQALQIETLKKTQLDLQRQNEILTRIFQGRDDDAVAYRKEGRETMRRIKDLEPILIETNGNCKEVLKSINKLYGAIEKHLEQLEKKGVILTTEEKTIKTEHKPA